MMDCGCATGVLCGEAQALWQNVLGLWRGYKRAAPRDYWGEEARRAWDDYIEARREYNAHYDREEAADEEHL